VFSLDLVRLENPVQAGVRILRT